MSELITHQPSDAFVKQATVSGMATYQALCKKSRNRLRRLLGRTSATPDQLENPFHQNLEPKRRALLQMV